MNRLSLFAAALALAALSLSAQTAPTCNSATIPVCTSGTPAGSVQIKPQAVPTSSTAVALTDAYLQTITVANTSGGALTFTLADRQASAVSVLSAVSIAANTTYVIAWPAGYWCPNGFTVTASGSGLKFYGAWRQ